MVNVTTTRFKSDKFITENTTKGLELQQPEMPKFYTRPKIYNIGNPQRAVVSFVNCHTQHYFKGC